MDNFTDFMMDKLIIPLLMILFFLVVAGLLFGLPYLFYIDSKAETFELKKGQWTCLDYHYYQSTTYIKIGNILTPSTTTQKDCVNYKKLGF